MMTTDHNGNLLDAMGNVAAELDLSVDRSMVPGYSILKAMREQWSGAHCVLDGKPALVAGRLEPFATIATVDGSQAIQFAWHTVNRIMRRDGQFKS